MLTTTLKEKIRKVNSYSTESSRDKSEKSKRSSGERTSGNQSSQKQQSSGPMGNIQRVTGKGSGTNIGGALISAVLIVFMLLAGYLYMRFGQNFDDKEVSLSDAVKEVEEGNVEKAVIRENRVILTLKPDEDSEGDDSGDSKEETREVYAYLEENASFVETLQREGLLLSDTEAKVGTQPVTKIDWLDVLSLVFMLLLAGGIFLFVRNMQGSGGRLLDFGQSKARLIFGKKSDVGFNDVAGIQESKEELMEIVQFLKDPKRFTKLGARIPKGVLLVGPPGSGKTLLARAVAGEAGVPFFHTSGSEFEEMLVGAGASRVRDLFTKARKAAPCIIFIDEIDAVAKKRGTTLHSGNTEQTLNQILVEMDGLEPRTNVIVMAATNRPDVLDPAILRPGRFDRHVALMLPDVQEREAILAIHAKDKKIAKNVNLGSVAKRTIGFSGADLENTLNEAAILAAKKGETEVSEKDIDEAALKVRYGPERRSKKREEEDIKMTAYHEAGHALVARFTSGADPVHGVSVISRGMSAGMTMFMPEKDREKFTQKQMFARIAVSTGGNVAEKIVFDDTSTGAAEDIKIASEIARDMVKKYGMSDKVGFVQYGDLDESSYLGYGYEPREYSDETARDIDMEVKRIVTGARDRAEKILREHEDDLHALADLLLEKEVIDADEFEKFFERRGGGDGEKKDSGSSSTEDTSLEKEQKTA